MDETQMRKWNASRRELFDVTLPEEVEAKIQRQLPALDYDRAMHALAVYRAEKPYKGFYLARFSWHYNTVPAASTDRAEGPAARPRQSNDYDAQASERREYAAIPASFIADCRQWFDGWGWPEGSRAWMLLCIDAFNGKPVDQYRCNAAFGSKEYDRAERIKQAAEAYDRQRLEALVCRMQARLNELGDDCATLTGFTGVGRNSGPGSPGHAARQKMRRGIQAGMAASVIIGVAKPVADGTERHKLDRCV
jgi:hypothetical protein